MRCVFFRVLFGIILLLSFSVTYADEQEPTISGKVTGADDTDVGLPGVTVVVKGTGSGTVTDIEGNFTVQAAEDATLIFSFVGYKTTEVPVNGRTVVNITLDMDISSLEEVVVVGYGEQKKANLTGAIASVKPQELEDIPVGNLANALIGKMPGVQINRNGTGIPGTDSPLVIRDESASGTVRQVLYVIDGFIYNNDENGNTGPAGSVIFNRLDPSEIESITILKDAAAAVYGARGAGGVVLVKTKRGAVGKPKFSYSGSFGVGQATAIPEMLKGYELAKMMNEISRINGANPDQTQFYFSDAELEDIRGRDYDWVDGLYKNATTARNAFNVSGGTENVRYFVGGSHYHETGNYENLWFKKYGVRSNLEAHLSKQMFLTLGMNYSQSKSRKPYYHEDAQPGVLRSWYKQLLTAPKWVPPTIDGKPVKYGTWNPYGLQGSDNFTEGGGDNMNMSVALDYKVPGIEGLKLNGSYAYNVNTSTGNRFAQDYQVYNLAYSGKVPLLELPEGMPTSIESNTESLRESFNRGSNYQLNTSVSYNKTLWKKHNLNALLVYEQAQGRNRELIASKTGLADIDDIDQFWAFPNTQQEILGRAYMSGRYSYIGRFNYDYDGKYILESTFRRESSNKFAPEHTKGIFPSVSVGWVLSEEGFFKNNVEFIDFLKLRVSAGRVGNDNVRSFEWKQSFTAETEGAYFGKGTSTKTNSLEIRNQGIIVPSRTWSKTNSYNFGLDVTMLGHKLNMALDYYYQFIFDGFQHRSNIPYELGTTSLPHENYKESFSEGIEYLIDYNDGIGKSFRYSISANFSWRHSRPLKLYQNPAVLGTWKDELRNDDSNQPGYIALGIIRTDADVEMVKAMYYANPTINGRPIEKGMIYYKDIGGPDYSTVPDGKIDSWDQTIIAEYTTAPYSYGFTLGASWKGLKLAGTFNGIFGHKDFIQKDEMAGPGSFSSPRNVFAWWGDYWTEENPDAKLPRPAYYGFENQISTFWMRDGHTLRLNNVSLSYSMPTELTQRLKLPQARFYCTVTNAWTIISPFDWKDPVVSQAYDYPLARTINFGINLSI